MEFPDHLLISGDKNGLIIVFTLFSLLFIAKIVVKTFFASKFGVEAIQNELVLLKRKIAITDPVANFVERSKMEREAISKEEKLESLHNCRRTKTDYCLKFVRCLDIFACLSLIYRNIFAKAQINSIFVMLEYRGYVIQISCFFLVFCLYAAAWGLSSTF